MILTTIKRRSILKLVAIGLVLATAPGFAVAQSADKLKIGVIGAGPIGTTIGGLWIKAGHSVKFSSRNPSSLKPLIEKMGPLSSAGSVPETIEYSDILFVSVPYRAIPDLAEKYGPKFVGKTVLDPTNVFMYRDGIALSRETDSKGVGQTTAGYLKGANVVRAFNSMDVEWFASEAHRNGDKMAIPIAGANQGAVNLAARLVRDAGFDPVEVPLPKEKLFAFGEELYGLQISASEFRRRLGRAE